MSSKTADADRLFTRHGFWRSIAPVMLFSFVFICGIVVFNLKHVTIREIVIALPAVFCVITLPQYLMYRWAGSMHDKLKQAHGAAYTDLVEDGKILVTPTTVALMGMPGNGYRRYLPSIE
ncbi:MAG: hypothetical protein EON61_11805 [Alphaproteobacteria bacterium]|nr:MAG: hypothetical protein EON61_11805 [Alphaproteobacteria bacterium]